ncbi:MAG: hypothetical protein ACK48E_07055, partial [Holosporales bacterium]
MSGWNTHPIQAIFHSSATLQEETPSWRGAERRGHPEKMNAGSPRASGAREDDRGRGIGRFSTHPF